MNFLKRLILAPFMLVGATLLAAIAASVITLGTLAVGAALLTVLAAVFIMFVLLNLKAVVTGKATSEVLDNAKSKLEQTINKENQ